MSKKHPSPLEAEYTTQKAATTPSGLSSRTVELPAAIVTEVKKDMPDFVTRATTPDPMLRQPIPTAAPAAAATKTVNDSYTLSETDLKPEKEYIEPEKVAGQPVALDASKLADNGNNEQDRTVPIFEDEPMVRQPEEPAAASATEQVVQQAQAQQQAQAPTASDAAKPNATEGSTPPAVKSEAAPAAQAQAQAPADGQQAAREAGVTLTKDPSETVIPEAPLAAGEGSSYSDDLKRELDKALQVQKLSNEANEANYLDLLENLRRENEASARESQLEADRTRQAAVWSGATELAAAIANMIGVGSHGSSNQTYKQYSHDWMRIASNEAKQARKERHAAQTQRANMEAQFAALKAKNAKDLAAQQLAGIRAVNAAQKNEASARYYNARAEYNNALLEYRNAKLALDQLKAQDASKLNDSKRAKLAADIKVQEERVKEIAARAKNYEEQAKANGARAGLYNSQSGWYDRRGTGTATGVPSEPQLP